MINSPDNAGRARWEVIWVSKKRKLVRHDCGDDMAEALRLYTKAVEAGKIHPTLRCKNMGFPPPEHLRPQHVTFNPPKRKPDGTRIFSAMVRPLNKLNRQGVWWCPYCIKLRRFVKRTGFTLDGGIDVNMPSMNCPVCGVSHRSAIVQRWNPIAITFEGDGRFRDPNRARRRRASRQRSKTSE